MAAPKRPHDLGYSDDQGPRLQRGRPPASVAEGAHLLRREASPPDGPAGVVRRFRVGYDNPSQSSREYRRQFAAPPLRDIRRLRGAA